MEAPTEIDRFIGDLVEMPPSERTEILDALDPSERMALEEKLFEWHRFARPEQMEPTHDSRWWILLFQTGRGWG